MHRVLVVGAGGSLAQAKGFRPVRAGVRRPPLDLDFFERVVLLAEESVRVTQALNRFRAGLRRVGSLPDPWLPVPSSLEQFFADVYYEVATTRSADLYDVFIALLDLYARVLEETTNWMAIRPRAGPIGRLLREELHRSEDDVLVVVTFNHDLVIENEVARLPYLGDGRWCLTSLYSGIDLEPVYSAREETFPHHDEDCEDEPPLVLLKLHGSLNWVLRTRSPDPQLGTLFPAPTARQRQVFVHDSRTAQHYGGVLRGGQGRPWYIWPLIVPPIYDKQRVTGTGVFEDVWGQAREALAATEHLTLVGYSLPDADVFAKQLLRRGFAHNVALEQVSVVNPDPGVVRKLSNVLGPRVVRIYRDIESYLQYSAL
jgi:hypothetical protein